jgi:glycosyltransferase involved in cell wall biosynthesis
MKIAQIVPSLQARHGGPSRSVRGLAAGLARTGQDVSLLTTGPLEESPPLFAAGLSTHAFTRQWPEALARATGLFRHLDEHRFDLIHHHGLWQRTLHYAHVSAHRANAPLVVSPRGMMSSWAWRHRRWKKQLASWLIHPRAFSFVSGWHATSEEEAMDIRRLGFNQPICVAPNGVIPPSPEEESSEAQHWQTLLPQLAGRRVALFYSRFHSKKRVLELMDLWLARPRDNWLLLVVGIPEQYSVCQLDAHLVRIGGLGRIIVQDGAGHPPPYAIASLFLLPSHSENFGLVVAEALVRGVPVLATDSTPWTQLAQEGAGDCVPWDTYSRALDTLLAMSAEALGAAGERARRWSRTTFSWEKAAAPVLEFYTRLVVR